jgi:hypothetical protein
MEVLQNLMETRHAKTSDDRIRALNRITVLFSDEPQILQTHRDLMASLSKPINTDGSVPKELEDEWNDAQWTLVSSIAEPLHVKISKEEFELGYAPRSISAIILQQKLMVETNKSLMAFARKDLGLRWDPIGSPTCHPALASLARTKSPRPARTPIPQRLPMRTAKPARSA